MWMFCGDVTSCSFSNLGILHVTKKGVVEVLSRRLREERKRQKGAHYHLTGNLLTCADTRVTSSHS